MTAAERNLLLTISEALLEMGGIALHPLRTARAAVEADETHEQTRAQRLADLAMAGPALTQRRAREALAGPVSGVGRSEEAVGAAATVASQRASVAVDEPPYTNTGTTAFNGTLCIGCEITLDIADPSVVAAEPARNVGQ